MYGWSAAFALRRAADIAQLYDRNATGEVRFNPTTSFHLCGLIERGASVPKSGATHRRSIDQAITDEAKALFCRTHSVPHPAAWEFNGKRTWQEVRDALLSASEADEALSKDCAASNERTVYAKIA